MGILHTFRLMARRLGIDVSRFPGDIPGYHRAKLMNALKVDCVIDGGANIGQFASELREFGYAGQIVSFEPVSSAYDRLRLNAKDDPNWTAVHCALGARPGKANINVSASGAISSSLLPMLDRTVEAAPHVAIVGEEEVEVRTLDEASTPLRDDARVYLKLDVQGFEAEVLDGSPRTLRQSVAVEIEMSLTPLYAGSPSWIDIMRRLEGNGFALARIDPGFTDPRNGRMLQVDGTFVRSLAD